MVAEEKPIGEIEPNTGLDLISLLNTMPVGVFVVDKSGQLTAINTAALRMIAARNLADARARIHPFDTTNFRFEDGTPIPRDCTPVQRALAGEEVADAMEVRTDGANGVPLVLRIKASPLRSPTGSIIGAVKVAVDVSREFDLARVKDDFIRSAAHELKTPLAVIRANADTALEQLADTVGPASRSLEGLSRGVDRADRLIDSLLDLLDIQGGLFSVQRVPVRLDDLLQRAISRLPHGAGKRVHVEETAPIEVLGDEPRLQRVVYSILDNAFKYSPKSSAVEVSLRRAGDAALISIRDHGFGIPLEKQPRIFEKYLRAHVGTPMDAGGIGVGLFVAREIVAQHNGQISFESDERQGTVFNIRIPVGRSRQS